MTISARIYLGAVMGAGALTLCAAFAQWSAEPDLSFLLMLILGTLVSSRKVRLPGLTGTISGGFAFVLFVAAVFDWQSTVAMAAMAALTQSLWAAKRRPAWYQVAFNVANIVVCAGLAHRASAAMVPENAIGRLAIAGLLLFLVNTFSVSTVLRLVESRPLRSAWDQCRFWAAPYYLAGGLVSGALAGTAAGTTTQLPTLLCLACTMTLMSAYYRTLLAFFTKQTA